MIRHILRNAWRYERRELVLGILLGLLGSALLANVAWYAWEAVNWYRNF